LYERAGFDKSEPKQEQRKFVLTTDEFIRLVADLKGVIGTSQQVAVGIALHSLRAVSLESMRVVLNTMSGDEPVHIHIAEQIAEVDACKKRLGTTPIRWLLDNANVDSRWCLVHATHATQEEMNAIAKSGASVCLCPTTEANLGDGVFDAKAFGAEGGTYAIGSDSHVSVAPTEELRWLEYQQRLVRGERNVLTPQSYGSTGEFLWERTARTGAHSSGRRSGALEVGSRADIVVLDTNLPVFAGREPAEMLDTFIFAVGSEAVRDVMVGGRWLVQERKHFAETAIASGYRRAIAKVRDAMR
jgi:formimidoylglutamate deiminase